MKKITLLFAILCIGLSVFAQVPTSVNYQAVLRNASGEVLANQDVSIKVALLQDTVTGVELFSETHNVTTNSFGLVNLQIGSQNPVEMATVDWSAGTFFIQISVDGTVMGISELQSVPFALRALSVEIDSVNDADADPANELQDIQLSGTNLSISQGSTVDLSVLKDGTGTDNQRLSLSNSRLTISNGNSVTLPFLTSESDPVYNSSVAAGITTADTARWNTSLNSYTETDPIWKADSSVVRAEVRTEISDSLSTLNFQLL